VKSRWFASFDLAGIQKYEKGSGNRPFFVALSGLQNARGCPTSAAAGSGNRVMPQDLIFT
jgi:hypothetical protein